MFFRHGTRPQVLGGAEPGVADALELNYGSVEQWERDVCRPTPQHMAKIEPLLGKIGFLANLEGPL